MFVYQFVFIEISEHSDEMLLEMLKMLICAEAKYELMKKLLYIFLIVIMAMDL